MSGFVTLGAIVLMVTALLWALRLRGAMLSFAAAAMAVGAAGYSLQGRPNLPGDARAASAGRTPPAPLTAARKAMMGEFTAANAWLTISESYASRGKTQDAVGILRSAIRARPRDYSLWVGLGNALADHARMPTPAARFAFARAAELAPNHPAPRFFLGLALARSGDAETALVLWRDVLANAPAKARWRPFVENGVMALGGGSAPAKIRTP